MNFFVEGATVKTLEKNLVISRSLLLFKTKSKNKSYSILKKSNFGSIYTRFSNQYKFWFVEATKLIIIIFQILCNYF